MKSLLFVVLGLLLVPALGNSDEILTVKISPRAAMAPASVTVQMLIDNNADNRFIDVVAESLDYYRSSQISLEGEHAPRAHEFRFKGLPAGEYQVSVVLSGTKGRRAISARTIQVVPGNDR